MEQNISFTQVIKSELANCSLDEMRLRAMLASFIKINGVLNIRESKVTVNLKTENADVAKLLHTAINKVYGLTTKFIYGKVGNFKKRTTYHLIIENGTDYLLSDLDISFLENKISKTIVHNDEMIAAYLAGAFLASGSVNSPKSSNYHLEFALNDEDYAKWFVRIIHRYHQRFFDAKITERRNKYIVYIKKSDQIADFLILMGATEGALKFEDVRISREFANIGNRLQNLDLANYQKTLDTAKKQIKNIETIDKVIGIEHLENVKEKTLARLRRNNPDATLNELAKLMSKELDMNISKSTLSRLFASLNERAERINKVK